MNKKYLTYAALVLVGVVLASKIRSLPGGNMLPTI